MNRELNKNEKENNKSIHIICPIYWINRSNNGMSQLYGHSITIE
jgi:hypothetical protein